MTSQPSAPVSTSTAPSAVSGLAPGRPNRSKNLVEGHARALQALRDFLSEKQCYDILPESFRLIVFDSSLKIKKALTALMLNGVVSAPLYDSKTYEFSGMFTLTDVIHLIQYFYLRAAQPATPNPGTGSSSLNSAEGGEAPSADQPSPSVGSSETEAEADPYTLAAEEVESFPLSKLKEIEQAIDAPTPPLISVHPDSPMIQACENLVASSARRLPLLERDEVTDQDALLCVLTQYRTLKFIAINAQSEVARLHRSIGSLGVGSYVSSYQPEGAPPLSPDEGAVPDPDDPFHPLAVATLDTMVFDVVHMFSDRGISAVPIIDDDGIVIDMYETVDIIDLVRTDAYRLLDLTIGEAIARRSPDFPGVTVCSPNDSVANILRYIAEKRVHRFVIVDDGPPGSEVGARAEGEGEGEGGGRLGLLDDRTPTVESEPGAAAVTATAGDFTTAEQSGKPAGVRGRLVGMLALSDLMQHIVGTKSVHGKSIVGLGKAPAVEEGGEEAEADVTAESAGDALSITPTAQPASALRLGDPPLGRSGRA